MNEEKQILLEETKGKLDPKKGFVILRHNAMNPNVSGDFRDKIRGEGGGSFYVVKKRILDLAVKELGMELELANLEGHLGVVSPGEQFTDTVKAVFDFKKGHADAIEVLAGLYEEKPCSAAEVEAISKLPSKAEMRAMLLGTLEAPMSHTLSLLQAVPRDVISCISQKGESE